MAPRRRLQTKKRPQVARKKSRSIVLFRSSNRAYGRKNRDFANRKHQKNPYKSEHTSQTKRNIQLAIVLVCFMATFGIILFHPFFRIDKVDVTGTNRLSGQEITDATIGVIGHKKMGIIPGNSYMFVDVVEVRDIIMNRFPIESVTVRRTFPNHLAVDIIEKTSTLIYDNTLTYSLIGLDGKIIEPLRKVGEDEWQIETETVTTSDKFGDVYEEEKEIARTHAPSARLLHQEIGEYPIILDMRTSATEIVTTTPMSPELTQAVAAWYDLLKQTPDIVPAYVVVGKTSLDMELHTQEGWKIKILLDETVPSQFEAMRLAFAQSSINRASLSYIDVRYDNRVYWK